MVGLGGVETIVVRSLGAGSDKGETELRLPLRLLCGLHNLFVVLLWFSYRSLIVLCCRCVVVCLVFTFYLQLAVNR